MPHLFTTETKSYRPLERRNDYPWEILGERLIRELGNEFSTFLAEPVTRGTEGFVDWYTESTVPGVPASDLSAEDREALFGRLHTMRARIHELADRITAPGRRDGDKRFADAIRRATVVPDDERFVWSLGGQPVLVLWGMLHIDDARTEAEVLGQALRYDRGRSPPAGLELVSPPAPQAPRRKLLLPLLLWLLFAGLMGAIYYLLLAKCDIAVGPRATLLAKLGINACVSTFVTPDGALRRQELEERIQKAELDIARQQGDCADPLPTPTPRPTPTPPPPAPTPSPSPSPSPTPPTPEEVCRQLQARGVPCDPRNKLQISLSWKGKEDLDLHIVCPGGEFAHDNRNGCGGDGYVDTNHDVRATPPEYNAIENGQWRNPPQGRYQVRVQLFDHEGSPPRDLDYFVTIRCGQQVKTVTGRFLRSAPTRETQNVYDLNYPACEARL